MGNSPWMEGEIKEENIRYERKERGVDDKICINLLYVKNKREDIKNGQKGNRGRERGRNDESVEMRQDER